MSETQEKRNVHETTIPANQYVEDAYVEFGREVNGNRMICDLSGCKPIWKKIIYMSHKIANGKLTKTADLAGQIMSKVHPHAECSSTISLLVRKNILAHKGNHGLDLLDSIPASAPRYTEV
jgi:DNA gyrase/topoisomerase IV subunit A